MAWLQRAARHVAGELRLRGALRCLATEGGAADARSETLSVITQSSSRHVEDYDASVFPLFATDNERIREFLALTTPRMREVLALAPPERLPRALGILPKDVRRRLAASPRGTIRRVMEGRPSMKKRLGGYTASDWTHSLFSAPSVRYPMSRADRAFMERDIPPGNEYLLYLEGIKGRSRDAFEDVVSGISQIKFLEDPERDPMAPLSVNVAAMLDKVVEWRSEFVMSPGTRDSHPVNRNARLMVHVGDLQRALGLSDDTARYLRKLAGDRLRGDVLVISSKGWRAREDNRTQAIEWLQKLVAAAVKMSKQAVPQGGWEPSKAFSGTSWLPPGTQRVAKRLLALEERAGPASPSEDPIQEMRSWRAASAALHMAPHGLEVPRSGLTGASLLAQWPKDRILALRDLARMEERALASVEPAGAASGAGAVSGADGGALSDKDELVAAGLAGRVAAQVVSDFKKTKGTAMAMAELEQRQLSSPNDVVRAWATAAQERRMNPGAEEELDESEADDAGVGETGPGVAES